MPIYEYRCEKCGQTNEFLILKKRGATALQTVRERRSDKAPVRSQYIQQLVSETSRTWLRKLLRDAQFMWIPGKLLLRVSDARSAPLAREG